MALLVLWFLLPNKRGMANPNRERKAWPWLLVLGASLEIPGAAGLYVKRRKSGVALVLLVFQKGGGDGQGEQGRLSWFSRFLKGRGSVGLNQGKRVSL